MRSGVGGHAGTFMSMKAKLACVGGCYFHAHAHMLVFVFLRKPTHSELGWFVGPSALMH